MLDRLFYSTNQGQIDIEELNKELQKLKEKNESDRQKVDHVFTEKNKREVEFREIEQEALQMQHEIDQQINQLVRSGILITSISHGNHFLTPDRAQVKENPTIT